AGNSSLRHNIVLLFVSVLWCFGLLFFNPNLSLPRGKKVCEKPVSSFSGKRQILQAADRSAGGFSSGAPVF
ncbi:MAG: hypothetical protein RR336_09175, partial [Oscillospiraceae bacterium]